MTEDDVRAVMAATAMEKRHARYRRLMEKIEHTCLLTLAIIIVFYWV